jgi:hypothetical protein
MDVKCSSRGPAVRTGPEEGLVSIARSCDAARHVSEEAVWERADVEAILRGIFDLNAHLATITRLLEDGDEEEDEGPDRA